MTIPSRYALGGIDVAGTLLGGVRNLRVDPGIDNFLEGGDGNPYPTFTALKRSEPVISFEMVQLKQALTAAGMTGFRIVSGSILKAYLKRAKKGGLRDTGNTHIRFDMTQGLLIPRRLTASLNEAATLQAEAHAEYDGSNNPITINSAVAGPADVAITELYKMGPVSINGTAIAGIQSWSLDFQHMVRKEFDNDEKGHYPSMVWINTIRPTLTFRMIDMTGLTTVGLTGAAQTATDSLMYLRGITSDGEPYLNSDAKHIKVSLDKGRVCLKELPAGQDDGAVAELQYWPVWDLSNDIVAITTDQTIS